MRTDRELRQYEVVLASGEVITVEAHYVFDNDEEGRGLMFRRYRDGRIKIEAQFAKGSWVLFKEV